MLRPRNTKDRVRLRPAAWWARPGLLCLRCCTRQEGAGGLLDFLVGSPEIKGGAAALEPNQQQPTGWSAESEQSGGVACEDRLAVRRTLPTGRGNSNSGAFSPGSSPSRRSTRPPVPARAARVTPVCCHADPAPRSQAPCLPPPPLSTPSADPDPLWRSGRASGQAASSTRLTGPHTKSSGHRRWFCHTY